MTNEERIKKLTDDLSKNIWFDSVEVDCFGKIVVFVHYSNSDIMKAIPDKFENKKVVWQYATSKSSIVKQKYATEYKKNIETTQYQSALKFIAETEHEPDMSFLISEIDRLEKLIGATKLHQIFFEVHDGKNAITELKRHFIDIYDDVLDLYEEFGFDIIHNELEK